MGSAVGVRHVGKRYSVVHGEARSSYRTIRESLAQAFTSALRKNGRARGAKPDDFWALDDVSFNVCPGEVVAIIGRNGAGKSTLLKILARTTKPTTGEVEIAGRIGSLLEVGTGFHPELTGRENIFMNGSVLGMARADIRRKFDDIVSFAEVERFLDTPVKRYSSGMYVRLAFAVAAHLEPEILIVDEVLAVGDSAFQKKSLGKLGDLSANGRTVLFVSHNMGAVAGLCDRAIWLDQGAVVADGPVRSTIDQYLRANAEASSARLVLEGHHRRIQPRAMRLAAIEWRDGAPLRHGESATAKIHFMVTAPAKDVSFGLGFSAPGGNRLLTYDSDFDGRRLDYRCCGAHTMTLEIDRLPLAPGTYAVDVAIRSGDSYSLDYVPACGLVDVYPSADTPAILMRHPGAGVRFGGHWSEDSSQG